MTTLPPEDDPAEVAEFWRLTQEALRRHPEALDEDPETLGQDLMDGLEHD